MQNLARPAGVWTQLLPVHPAVEIPLPAMIVISGTKRSGTSMWMQVMAGAGFKILGDAFPRNWAQSLKQANPDGFYESILRQGIYWRTNPHPQTGRYFLPEDVDGYAVKIFIPGVIRTERAYISQVIANIREWREYESSIERLYTMEDEARAKAEPNLPRPERFPPVYEWWMENFALVRDISLRRYPARLMSYDRVISDPEKEVTETLKAIGSGDIRGAIEAVKPENRTQKDSTTTTRLPSNLVELFDDFYHAIHTSQPISGPLLEKLNVTNRELLPELTAMQKRVAVFQSRRRAEMQKKGRQAPANDVNGLPTNS